MAERGGGVFPRRPRGEVGTEACDCFYLGMDVNAWFGGRSQSEPVSQHSRGYLHSERSDTKRKVNRLDLLYACSSRMMSALKQNRALMGLTYGMLGRFHNIFNKTDKSLHTRDGSDGNSGAGLIRCYICIRMLLRLVPHFTITINVAQRKILLLTDSYFILQYIRDLRTRR